jgi:hypothetical protein
MGKTTTWMVNMKKLVGQGELGGVMVRLMMALQDFAQANHAMQAWKTEQSLKPKSRKVGAGRYFLRMQISHIFEAFEIVQNEIEPSAELKAALKHATHKQKILPNRDRVHQKR